jgi:predicted Fe-S protein YdhL (DUF1289 family)
MLVCGYGGLLRKMSSQISTPCIQVCKLNAHQECIGCGRSLEEIAQWQQYSEPTRQAIMKRLEARKQKAGREDTQT